MERLKQERSEDAESSQPWWKPIRGTFKDDAAYAEAMRLGREYRQSLRPQDDAAETQGRLRKAYPRGGTMDLKIAAIALAPDAVLLTRNRADFKKIPDLRFKDGLA